MIDDGKRKWFIFTMPVLVCLLPIVTLAQDTHYWNDQFGSKGMLLSGAIIGSVSDMSATFYNPGGLGYADEPAVLISTNAYEVSNLTVRNGAGQGFDLKSSDFNILPNLVAGSFTFDWLGQSKLAYSILTRYRFSAELRGTRVGRVDVLPDSPGEEEFAGGLLAHAKTNELWVGLTWSIAVHEKVGIGITQYFSARDRNGQFELFAQALDDSGNVALAFDLDTFSLQAYSLLWKAGLGFNFKPLTLGLTLTTPNMQLIGSGDATFNTTRIGLDEDGDGAPDDYFETDIQQGAQANYHAPLSVGAGAGLYLNSTRIHVSAEWFDEVAVYDVLELEGFISQRTGEEVLHSLQHSADSVLNYAIGLEQRLSTGFTGYLSFNTDYSSMNSQSDLGVTGFDLFHVSGGANFTLAKIQFMLGLRYAWGSDQTTQIIDLNPEEESDVVDPDEMVNLDYSKYTFLIGFSVDY